MILVAQFEQWIWQNCAELSFLPCLSSALICNHASCCISCKIKCYTASVWLLFHCVSSGVPPNKATFIDDLVVMLPQNVWDHLYSRYTKSTLLLSDWLEALSIFRSSDSFGWSNVWVCMYCFPQVRRGTGCQPPVCLPHVPDWDRKTGEKA